MYPHHNGCAVQCPHGKVKVLVGHESVGSAQLLDEADVVADQAAVGQCQQHNVHVEVAKQRVGPAGLLGQRVQQENRKTQVERCFAADEPRNLQQVRHGRQAGQHKGQEGPPQSDAGVLRLDCPA